MAIRATLPCATLTHRTKKRRASSLHDALDRAVAARRRARTAFAIVDTEICAGTGPVRRRSACGRAAMNPPALIASASTSRIAATAGWHVRAARPNARRASKLAAWARGLRDAGPHTHRCCRGLPHALIGERGLDRRRLALAGARQDRGLELIAQRLRPERPQQRLLVQFRTPHDLHRTKAPRIVEGDARARRHVEHDVVVRPAPLARSW